MASIWRYGTCESWGYGSGTLSCGANCVPDFTACEMPTCGNGAREFLEACDGDDLAVRHLRELGVQNAIVNAGGDLRAIGSRAGHPWRIAIRRPSGTGVFATIDVTGDASIFTSGHYERNFTHEGKTYHHIIDPRTGFPAEGAQSVTVVHTDATTADAAATALFIAGPDSWHQVATDMGIRYVVLVDSQGVLHMNPAMAERIELLDREVEVVISPPLGAPAPTGRHPAPSGAESAQEAPERN